MAVNEDCTRGGKIHGAGEIEQGRLAAAAAPDQSEELARSNGKRDVVQRAHFLAITRVIFDDIAKFDQRHRAGLPSICCFTPIRVHRQTYRKYGLSSQQSAAAVASRKSTASESGIERTTRVVYTPQDVFHCSVTAMTGAGSGRAGTFRDAFFQRRPEWSSLELVV